MRTIEECYKIYELATRIKRKSGYKYSTTKNIEYYKIKEEIDKIIYIMAHEDIEEINIEEIFVKVYSLDRILRLLNWESSEWKGDR